MDNDDDDDDAAAAAAAAAAADDDDDDDDDDGFALNLSLAQSTGQGMGVPCVSRFGTSRRAGLETGRKPIACIFPKPVKI